jgi:steroid delta-isomerase-like uncharacterized protein
MTRQDVIGLLDRWQDALSRQNVDDFSSLYAADASIESPMIGPTSGRDGAIKVFSAFFAAFPDAAFAWETPVVDGRLVSVAAFLSGTDEGGFMGLAPSGKRFSIPIVFLLEIDSGLITRDRRIYDFTGLLIQIGVLKAKPA